jgi:hypothetical protein
VLDRNAVATPVMKEALTIISQLMNTIISLVAAAAAAEKLWWESVGEWKC